MPNEKKNRARANMLVVTIILFFEHIPQSLVHLLQETPSITNDG